LNNLHAWVFVKWELKELKLRIKESQVPSIWKKIENQRTVASFGYFKKTSQNCRVSRKPGKEELGRFLGGYFTFTIWDLSFRTSTDRQTWSRFQDLNRRDLSFKTSTNRRTDLLN
jgi:hypothetical protein